MSRNFMIGLGVCGLLATAACCCLLLLAGAGGWWYFRSTGRPGLSPSAFPPPFEFGTSTPFGTATPVPVARRSPTPAPRTTPLPQATNAPATPPTADAGPGMEALLAATTPELSDLRVLAEQLKGVKDIPVTVVPPSTDYALGTELDFNINNTDNDTNPNSTIKARLVYKTDNVYFFAQRGVNVNQAKVKALLDDFQNRIYPTDREYFGSEWTPGVDGDPHLFILYAHGLGQSLLGYYSSLDEYSRLAHPQSNEKEIFYISADNTQPGDSDIASTLAHEFQHMIHWYQDRNEETWMNEGASMLAEVLNGYGTGSVAYAGDFTAHPDLQLTDWTPEDIPHYGAALLFMTYFLDRFGETAGKALIADQANGLTSVDQILHQQGLSDPATGRPLTADDVLADWFITNRIDDPAAGDGRYAYQRLKNVPTAEPADTFRRCPVSEQTASVHQAAANYYVFECAGTYTLTFQGATRVPVLPADPASGHYALWGNRADESVSTLTHAFDFSGLSRVTVQYNAWWDIEDGYDYAYLEVSTDQGQTWQTMPATHATDANPQSSNYGWGYTGSSGGWQAETADLSAYAGQAVLVRFQYITDGAVNQNGFLVDDIRLPELNYATDFEQDAGGWETAGFVRLENSLLQKFVVQLIHQAGGQTTVERLALDAGNAGQATLTLARGDTLTLVVGALTRFTTETAEYRFAVNPP